MKLIHDRRKLRSGIMERLEQYVIPGDFEKDAEQGFGWLGWLSWTVIFAAVFVFWPAVWRFLSMWTR